MIRYDPTLVDMTSHFFALCILTDFNYATLTSLNIFQKTAVCKISFLREYHPELASSANALDLNVQLNWTTLFVPYEFSHLNIS